MRANIDVDADDANLTGFASNVTGATFTLTATAATDGLAHKISVRNDSATNHSAKTIALVGTDPNGHSQTETIAAPGASATVESTLYWLTLTSATPSATIGADTFDIGWVDEVATRAVPLNWKSGKAATCFVDVTGTIDFTVQMTFDNIFESVTALQGVKWVDIAALWSASSDALASVDVNARAVRLLVNSYSSGAELQFRVNQSDNV